MKKIIQTKNTSECSENMMSTRHNGQHVDVAEQQVDVDDSNVQQDNKMMYAQILMKKETEK